MFMLIHILDPWWSSFSEIFLFQREQHRQKHLNPGSLLNWADGVIGLTPQTNSIKYFRRSNTNSIIFFAKFSSHIWKSDSVQLFLLRLCSMCRYLTRRGLIIGIGIRKCTEQLGSSLPLNWGETKVSCNIFRFLRTCHNYIQDSILHFQDVSSMVLILSTLLLS